MALKIAVSPAGYDNIGQVLQSMAFDHQSLKEESLTQVDSLAGYDVVFLNCSQSCERWAKPAAAALQAYVAGGGALYCSDFAADYVAAAFPGVVTFGGKQGSAGELTARVVDVGLQGALGQSLPLHFDMGGWVTIVSAAKEAETYLEGPDARPLLVTFKYGKGEVIYTCFHNGAQAGEQIDKLMRFQVLKPLLARAKAGIEQFVVGKSLGTVENVGVVSPGKTSQDFSFEAKGAEDLRFLLNWVGQAELSLTVMRPDGQSEREARAVVPPLEIEVPRAAAGRWRYRVQGVNVPERNFPFVLLVGPAIQVRTLDPFFMRYMEQRAAVAQPNSALLDAIELLDSPAPTPIIDIEIDWEEQ